MSEITCTNTYVPLPPQAALRRSTAKVRGYGSALARLGELNPEFATEGKGAWQVRAERAEADNQQLRAALEEWDHDAVEPAKEEQT